MNSLVNFNGSTAGQNLNSNTFLTARSLMLQLNSQGIIFNAKAVTNNKKLHDLNTKSYQNEIISIE